MEEQIANGGRRTAGRSIVTAALMTLVLGACVIPGKAALDVSPRDALTGPKVVAIMGTRNEVVAALEDALAEHGFTFRHYVSRERVTEPIGQVKMGEKLADNTKYAIEVTSDVFDHCMGGGFALASLSVSVIDRSSNELMLRATAKGRTEKCPPASGRVFHDIAAAIDAAWHR
jgi:hypothetical protein